MSDKPGILPARPGETDSEARMREAINRLGGQMIDILDSALALRTAPPDAQRARHIARGHLVSFSITAMHALALKEEPHAPGK